MSYKMKKTGFSLKENIALLSLSPPNSKGVLGRSWMAKQRGIRRRTIKEYSWATQMKWVAGLRKGDSLLETLGVYRTGFFRDSCSETESLG